MIKAWLSLDPEIGVSHTPQVKFDAKAYFEAASTTDDNLRALAGCGWSGDYPSDDVAWHFDGVDSDVTRLFFYASTTKEDRTPPDEPFEDDNRNPLGRLEGGRGFECTVDVDDALKWVAANRPALLAELCEASGKDVAEFAKPPIAKAAPAP